MSEWPVGTGEMAERIRAFDWAASPLGPAERWPQSLRTTIDLILAVPGPTTILWGPAHVQIYNDAYIPIARGRHPVLLGRPVAEGWTDIYQTVLVPLLDAAQAGQATRLTDFSVPLKGADGQIEERVFDSDWSPIRDETGAIAGALQTLVETTERRTAQTALRESEARHRLLIESWTQAVWEADANGEIVTDSQSWRDYTGQTAEEWLGYGWLNALHPDDRANIERKWREALAAPGLVEAEYRFRASDGGWRWTNVRAAPVLDAEGRIEKWAGMNIDIDARKRAEAALRESEARYRTLFNSIDEGFCTIEMIFNAEGKPIDYRFLELNAVFERQARFSIAPGQRMREIAPDHEQFWFDRYGRIAQTGEPERFEHKADSFDVFYDVYAFRIGDPALRRVAVLFRDITERNRALKQLCESKERQEFFLQVSDTLRLLSDPASVQTEALKLLVEHLGLVRAAYYEIDEDQNGMTLAACVETDNVNWPRRMTMSDFGPDISQTSRAGETYVVDDAETDPRLTEQGRVAITTGLGIRRLAGIPLVKAGRLRIVLGIHAREPSNWRESELQILNEFADRTWSSAERARAEAALRESEERFAQFAASSSDALWIRDAATLGMEYTSPAIETIYGIDPDAILGGMERWVELIVPEDRETAVAHIEQARAGVSVTHEFRIRRPSDGAPRWIRNTDFPLRDRHGQVLRIGGIAQDMTEAKRASERLEILVNELQHRSRNLLGVVTSMANRTVGRGSSAESFLVRLKALSRAQALLSQGGADTVAVEALVRAELAAHADNAPDRIRIGGPAVALTSQQVQNFALALHELTTNAVKYGALENGTGHLSVTWELIQTAGGRNLALTWTETGVDVQPEKVTRRGYGRELIEQALAYALGGRTEYVLDAGGVRCRIELPVV